MKSKVSRHSSSNSVPQNLLSGGRWHSLKTAHTRDTWCRGWARLTNLQTSGKSNQTIRPIYSQFWQGSNFDPIVRSFGVDPFLPTIFNTRVFAYFRVILQFGKLYFSFNPEIKLWTNYENEVQKCLWSNRVQIMKKTNSQKMILPNQCVRLLSETHLQEQPRNFSSVDQPLLFLILMRVAR